MAKAIVTITLALDGSLAYALHIHPLKNVEVLD